MSIFGSEFGIAYASTPRRRAVARFSAKTRSFGYWERTSFQLDSALASYLALKIGKQIQYGSFIMTQEILSPPDDIDLLVTGGKESSMSRASYAPLTCVQNFKLVDETVLNHQLFHRKPALLSDPSASHFKSTDEI
jgi:hypothetical protein